MENKKQGFLGAYKCLVLFAVMMVIACVMPMLKPKAQTYTATASGFVGQVTVQVSITNGKMTAIQILESTETVGVADPALEQIPAAILAAQSTDVDVVAGASFASRAIMTAVDDCLVQAGLKEAPVETTEAPTTPGAGTEYTAKSKGYLSDVTVTVTVDANGTITGCVIDASGETPALGGVAAEKLAKKIVENQGEIDVVTSATYTSKAIMTALQECLTAAGK